MQHSWLKKLAFITASALSANAFAVGPGLYLGVMAGPSTNNASDQQLQVEGAPTSPPTTVLATPKSQQFGSRIMMGYMVNEYAGVEGGLTYFSTIRYDSGDVNTCSGANSSVRDFELLAKGVMPFRQVNAFGKAGVALAYQNNAGAFNPTSTSTCGESTYTTKFVPAFSLGVGYDLSQNWVADISANNIMYGGKVGTMTMYALGISYHFVDIYCGQFLCT